MTPKRDPITNRPRPAAPFARGRVRLAKSALMLGAILLLIAGASAGCRSARRGEPIVGPLAISDPAVARGRLVFQQHCHSCHPGGEGGLGPALNDKPLPKFLMKTQVRLGLGAMPGFDKHTLPPDELSDLMKYVVALRDHTGSRSPH